MVREDVKSVEVAEEKFIVFLTSLCSGATWTQKAALLNNLRAEITDWHQNKLIAGLEEGKNWQNINEDMEATLESLMTQEAGNGPAEG